MKTKVIITNGEAQIELTPENEFEKEVIEKIIDTRYAYSLSVDSKYNYGSHSNHKITIDLKDTK